VTKVQIQGHIAKGDVRNLAALCATAKSAGMYRNVQVAIGQGFNTADLIVMRDGRHMARCTFWGTPAPVKPQTFAIEDGVAFLKAVGEGDGNFTLIAGKDSAELQVTQHDEDAGYPVSFRSGWIVVPVECNYAELWADLNTKDPRMAKVTVPLRTLGMMSGDLRLWARVNSEDKHTQVTFSRLKGHTLSVDIADSKVRGLTTLNTLTTEMNDV